MGIKLKRGGKCPICFMWVSNVDEHIWGSHPLIVWKGRWGANLTFKERKRLAVG